MATESVSTVKGVPLALIISRIAYVKDKRLQNNRREHLTSDLRKISFDLKKVIWNFDLKAFLIIRVAPNVFVNINIYTWYICWNNFQLSAENDS